MTDTVCLAYVHDTDVAYSFHDSLVNLLLFDGSTHGRIMTGGYVAIRCARSSDLVAARNQAIEGFLARPAEWLFFVDTDMGFTADTVERLLAVADPVSRPIVGALCFAQKETDQDGLSGYRTAPRVTILDWVDAGAGPQFYGRARYPVNTVVQCAATGSACILIHRSVFERIRDEDGPVWYDRIPGRDGSLLGEDVSFCVRAGGLGIPVSVHTGVKTSHLKRTWVAEGDFWHHAVVPPAPDRVAVVVPVMRRPQNAEPFMRSLRASTGMATVYAVADVDDLETAGAWRAAGAEVIEFDGDAPGTFAEKLNRGYQVTSEPWLFMVGDDVAFRPGWLDHAQAAASDGVHVVGTNDLGNPKVIEGDHATHVLIRRSYVDEVGASWDGPKSVAHEGYRHWFVDNEIVVAARHREVWAMALGSIVEHLHPRWGKAETDDVYELGESHAIADRNLFEKRLRRHVG